MKINSVTKKARAVKEAKFELSDHYKYAHS
jgi:hypothetical protein